MSKKVKFLILLVVVALAGYFGYNYVMTGGARDLETEKSEFAVAASAVFTEFSTNPDSATTKYLNKAVEISGKVTAVNGTVVTLDEKVSCQLNAVEKVDVNSEVKIKGRVTGYDDLLEELKLDQCIILK